ncbi:MAG: arginine--tRNA ligase [Acidobacteria bacterium]|nr:MAG: arginine--tRNA ligase [Acidobacteriota bacterium]
MYLALEQSLGEAVRAHLRQRYDFEPAQWVVEQPPRPELGEFALPFCFELAKQQRRAPRQLAQEIAAELALPPGFARLEVAGAGYLNFYVDRLAAARSAFSVTEPAAARSQPGNPKVIVEHTNINPNKAAHIGHLRNAVLGDTWVRLLRGRGEHVEVQNLQDNTGVQVADVVAAFIHLAEPSTVEAAAARVEAALAGPGVRFDYLCWDQYAAISQRYADDEAALKTWRPDTLHAIEAGDNPVAALADRISTAIARAHLQTMQRLGIAYDLLPRESEILQLHLWDHAFRLLQERQAIRLETEGKNAGCWVMDRPGTETAEGEEDTKVIVRSNGTVTYVAKDIAYQLWKFGLLPLEFGYTPFYQYPNRHIAWRTALARDPAAPAFGRAGWVFNVIDTRQTYLQDVVVDGLRALGYAQQAEHSVHFSYEMVALSPACAAELGYAAAEGEKRVDVSGRKGTGVKADDLLDRLQARTHEEVAKRHPDMPAAAQRDAADAIAIGALRYFLLKFTRNTVIVFDFKEALNFEGETGPYVQYAAVRAQSILDKAGSAPDATFQQSWSHYLNEPDHWNLLWLAAGLEQAARNAVEAREPAMLAKYAFELARAFNTYYHHHPVLQEPDADKRAFLLAIVRLTQRRLAEALQLMGVRVPLAM